MASWVITRTVAGVTRYRSPGGRLTTDKDKAARYESASEALLAAQEGDVCQQDWPKEDAGA